jgi:hypothetical protein
MISNIHFPLFFAQNNCVMIDNHLLKDHFIIVRVQQNMLYFVCLTRGISSAGEYFAGSEGVTGSNPVCSIYKTKKAAEMPLFLLSSYSRENTCCERRNHPLGLMKALPPISSTN